MCTCVKSRKIKKYKNEQMKENEIKISNQEK